VRRRHPLWCCLLLLACLVTGPAKAHTVAPVVDRVRFYAPPGCAEQMVGGRFVGSNTGETVGFVELGRIEGAPPEGQWTELELSADRPWRYVKYVGPDGSHGLVAELEFYAGNRKLEGEPFGVAGAREGGRDFHRAIDGDTSTWFDAFLADGAYVGLDLGTPGNVAPAPCFHPAPGHHRRALVVTITSAVPGGRVLYTTDGSLPTPEHGQQYREPVYVAEGVTRLRAIVCREGLFPGPIASGTYRVGDVPPPCGLTTFHVGNSLTDTINGWLKPVAGSAGYAHTYYRFTIPGAPTDWLWAHPGSGFGARNYPRARLQHPHDRQRPLYGRPHVLLLPLRAESGGAGGPADRRNHPDAGAGARLQADRLGNRQRLPVGRRGRRIGPPLRPQGRKGRQHGRRHGPTPERSALHLG